MLRGNMGKSYVISYVMCFFFQMSDTKPITFFRVHTSDDTRGVAQG